MERDLVVVVVEVLALAPVCESSKRKKEKMRQTTDDLLLVWNKFIEEETEMILISIPSKTYDLIEM